MTAATYHFTTTASTNLQMVRAGQSGNFKGYCATNASTAAPQFLKLYWYTPTAAAPLPLVGTAIPGLTISLPFGTVAGQGQAQSWPDGITGNGQLWAAVTAGAADSDNTNATAGSVITLLVE